MHPADQSVDLTHPPRVPRLDVDVAEEAGLALVAVDDGVVSDPLVRRDDHAALAAGDHLRRVEGEGRGDPERTGVAAVERRAVGVRGILDELHAAPVAEPAQISDVPRDEAADVHEDDRRRVRGQRRFDGGGAQRERGGVDVGEDDPAPGVGHRGGRRVEGVGRHDHVAPGHVQAAQDDLERGGPGADRHGVRCAVSCREGILELPGVPTQGQTATGQDACHLLVDLLLVLPAEDDPSRWYLHPAPQCRHGPGHCPEGPFRGARLHCVARRYRECARWRRCLSSHVTPCRAPPGARQSDDRPPRACG